MSEKIRMISNDWFKGNSSYKKMFDFNLTI